MSVLNSKISLRGFSKGYEDTFGEYEDTANAADYFVDTPDEPAPIMAAPNLIYTDADSANGTFGATTTANITYGFEGEHVSVLKPDIAGTIIGAQATTETNTGAGPYTHKYKFQSSGSSGALSIKSRNMLEAHGNTIDQYSGVVAPEFEIIADKSGYVKLRAALMGYAAKKTSSFTLANMVTQTVSLSQGLKFGDAKMIKGTHNTGTDSFTAVDTYNPYVESFSIKHAMNIVDSTKYQMGSQTGLVKAWDVGGISCEVKAKVHITAVDSSSPSGEAQNWLTWLMGQTEFALQFPIVGALISGSDYFTVTTVFPKVRLKAAKEIAEDGILKRELDFEVIYTPNDYYMMITIIDSTASHIPAIS